MFRIIDRYLPTFLKLFYTAYYRVYFKLHPAIERQGKLFVTGPLYLKIDIKSKFIIGDGVVIHSGYKANPFGGCNRTVIAVYRGGRLEFQDRVGISNSGIYCSENILVEEDAIIGGGSQIYDTDFHPVDYLDRIEYRDVKISKPILIKNGAFIGGFSHIKKGVTIGEKAVVASGSVVVKDVCPLTIVGGNPAKKLRDIIEV